MLHVGRGNRGAGELENEGKEPLKPQSQLPNCIRFPKVPMKDIPETIYIRWIHKALNRNTCRSIMHVYWLLCENSKPFYLPPCMQKTAWGSEVHRFTAAFLITESEPNQE